MPRKKATHLHFTKGKRVFVKLTDGECFVDKFLATNSRSVSLDARGRVLNKDIASMTIYRDGGTRDRLPPGLPDPRVKRLLFRSLRL